MDDRWLLRCLESATPTGVSSLPRLLPPTHSALPRHLGLLLRIQGYSTLASCNLGSLNLGLSYTSFSPNPF